MGIAFKEAGVSDDPAAMLDWAINNYETHLAEKAKKQDEAEEDEAAAPAKKPNPFAAKKQDEAAGDDEPKQYKMGDVYKMVEGLSHKMDQHLKLHSQSTKEAGDGDPQVQEAIETIIDVQEIQATQLKELEQQNLWLNDQLQTAVKEIQAITGNVPASLAEGYRPTEDEETVKEDNDGNPAEAKTEKAAGQGFDGFLSFVTENGQGGHPG